MKALYCLLIGCICVFSCREQYDPKARSLERLYLVVEANLDPGPDSTIIRLTKTFSLDDTARLRTENNAVVRIEGEDNSTRILTPAGNGYYVSPNLNLTIGTGYRLSIRTIDGKEYLSDYVKARVTPPIDSLNSIETNDKVWIYANTHDPSGNSKYYRWSYDETWEINSYYYSELIWDNALNAVRYRIIPGEEIFRCWKYDTSKTILLANSTRLQEDIIYRAPLTAFTFDNEKVSVRYSMFARQYALDKEAYDFFELMKKNTEEIGSVFSPQPFELKGNIRCITDETEYTLGYVTASTVQKKRLFVRISRPSFYQNCPTENIYPGAARHYFAGEILIPYTIGYDENGGMFYNSSYPECVDCRRRGGNLKMPSYW